MHLCALCQTPISEDNNSLEHIIPAAIGGHDVVECFMCDGCNSRAGQTWDANLTTALNWFSVALNIRRERGAAPRQKVATIAGTRYWLNANGVMESAEPPVQKVKTETGHEFRFSVSNMEMARIKLKEIASKYPEVNAEKLLAAAQSEIVFVDDPILVSIQLNESAARSIVKTALARAFQMGISIDNCEAATAYLRTDLGNDAWSAFYERDLVKNRPAGQLTHCVAVRADPASRTILAYVEYYSSFRYVVLLGLTYSGPHIESTVAFDPVTWDSVDLSVDMDLSSEERARVINGTSCKPTDALKAYNHGFPIALRALHQRQFENNVARAIREAFEVVGCKPGDTVVPEKIEDFYAYLNQRIEMYIRRLRQPRGPQDGGEKRPDV